jgi:hypothetical protein
MNSATRLLTCVVLAVMWCTTLLGTETAPRSARAQIELRRDLVPCLKEDDPIQCIRTAGYECALALNQVNDDYYCLREYPDGFALVHLRQSETGLQPFLSWIRKNGSQ